MMTDAQRAFRAGRGAPLAGHLELAGGPRPPKSMAPGALSSGPSVPEPLVLGGLAQV